MVCQGDRAPGLAETRESAYRKHGEYSLIPVVGDLERPTELQPQFDHAIRKRQVMFRLVSDVGPDDVDVVALGGGAALD